MNKFYKKVRYDPAIKSTYKVEFPDLSVNLVNEKSLQESCSGTSFKRSVNDYKWKKDLQESSETIEEINRKAKSISIPYNKSAYMYIDSRELVKDLGKK